MASPAHARELIELGAAPLTHEIRTYEFLNYYRIEYPTPAFGSLLLVPQMESAADPGAFDLQIGVRSWDAPSPRRPITVTFVLDTSGSMEGEPIARERAAIKAIASTLAAGDIVSMVTWNTDNTVVMSGHEVSGPNDQEVIARANSISADGGTDLHGGLVAGYALAQQHYGAGRLNRVVLISDAGANVGVTDEDLIALHSEDADQEGIYMVGVGTGPATNYNDALMNIVTDKGRGAYVYLDSVDEATRILAERFDEVMEVAARGVQVELTLPWYFKIEKFYGEEYSTDPKEIEPQHLAPGDAMIFNQIVKACDPSVVNQADTIKVTARWQTPITYLQQETSVEISVADLLAGGKEQLTKGKAIVAYAEALKLRTKAALHDAHTRVLAANPGGDPELDEIAYLIEQHPVY
jgi:Ca-activated chloride channel family protein